VQIELVGTADELLALGVPDSRPETLGQPVSGSLPLTLIHEEVHDGNVHVRGGRPVFIDWAEASVSHPFAGLINTLRVVGWTSGWQPDSRKCCVSATHTSSRGRDSRRPRRFARSSPRVTRSAPSRAPVAGSGSATENAGAWREIDSKAMGPDARLGA
jgi:hypothetical protein